MNRPEEIKALITSVSLMLKQEGVPLSDKKIVFVDGDRYTNDGINWATMDKKPYEYSPYGSVYKLDHDIYTACLKCGYSNPVGAEFCEQCNTKIIPKESVPAYARRSPMDYTPPFLVETVLKTSNALIGERKLVTVLFMDVANFTAISEELDPEDVHDIMDGCFETLGQKVHGAGGTINQYTGDGIMVLFGAPIAFEDDVRTACHAALPIQMRMREYHQTVADRYNAPFKLSIGMNTGMVVVGAIGDNLRLDYTAVGDTTNLAARLQGLAKPGEILVSNSVRRGAKNHFVFDNAGQLSIKGKKKPLQAFILIGEPAVEYPGEDLENIKISFVGRDKEISALRKAFEEAIKKGPNIVTVTGESGIGKSRLIRYFRKSLANDNVVFLEGNCAPYSRSIPLFPIEKIFRIYFNISEKDSIQQVKFKMNHRLKNMPQSPNLNKLLNLFSEFRKKPVDSQLIIEGAKWDLFRAVRDLLISISTLKPMIMIIDEIQWMDASTLDFIHFFLKYEENLPLLFIFMETPDARFRISGILIQYIHLKPLPHRQTLNLFLSVMGTNHFDLDIDKTMVNKMGGNPLFLVEMGKNLKRQGLIVRDHLKCKLKVPLSQIETPDSIKGVLAACLDALLFEKKHLVQLAAVIGREFSLDLLKPLAAVTNNLTKSLKSLEREKIFERTSLAEGERYQFRQQLMQELAYHTLLRRDRRHYHRLVGESIETLYRQNLNAKIGLLSHHFYKAQDWPKALGYTLEAAEHARNSFACNEALTFIDRALDILSKSSLGYDDLKKLELYQKKGETHFNLGQMESAHQEDSSGTEKTIQPSRYRLEIMRMKKLNIVITMLGLLLLTAHISMAGMLTFDGEIRERFESLNGLNAKAYGDSSIDAKGEVKGESNDMLLLSRIIAGFTYRQNKNISYRVHMYDARVWGWSLDRDDYIKNKGTPDQYVMDPDEDHFEFFDANVEINDFPVTGLSAILGRQRIVYGDHRIFGPGDWGNSIGWIWDAIHLTYQRRNKFVASWYGRTKFKDPDEFSPFFREHVYQGVGIYSHCGLTKHGALEPFFAWKNSLYHEVSPEENTFQYGVRLYEENFHGLNYDFTYSERSGDIGDKTVRAYAYVAKVGYLFEKILMVPNFVIGRVFASGDNNPHDDTIETYQKAFGSTIGSHYGRMDMMSWSNLVDNQVSLYLTPVKNIHMKIGYHHFSLDEPEDSWRFYGYRNKPGNNYTHLGNEIDLQVKYNYSKNWKFQFIYAYFKAGDFVKYNVENNNAQRLFIQCTYKFNIGL